jgi:O-antigen/teichoic acid export membrane protein/glycosyltransferase involved in cell wall biosynthesis
MSDPRTAAALDEPFKADRVIEPVALPALPIAGVRVNRLVSNTLVQFVNPGLRMVLGLILAGALSRYLGVNGFGQYALVFAYVATFSGVLSDWGLGTICLREMSRAPRQRLSLIAGAASLQALIAVVSYLVMLASLFLLHYPRAVSLAIALYGLTMLLTPLDLLTLPFQADLRLNRLVTPSVLGTLMNFILTMAVVWNGGPLLLLVGAALVSLSVQYVWTTRLSLNTLDGRLRPTRAHWGPLLRESWPLALSTTVSTALQQAPILALSLVSLSAVGLFNAANRIPLQLLLLPLAVRLTTFPLLSSSWLGDRPRFVRQLDRLVQISLQISIPLAILGIGLAGPLVQLIFGPQFVGASVAFSLLIGVFAVIFPGILLGEALIAAGFQRLSLAIQALSLPWLGFLLLVLIPRGGAAGAALALLLCYATIVAAVSAVAWWKLGATWVAPAMAKGIAAAFVGLLVLQAGPQAGLLPTSLLGALVAFAILAFLGNLSPMELLQAVAMPTKSPTGPSPEPSTPAASSRRARPLRVALVYPIPFGEDGMFGGGERYALELATFMSARVDTVLVTIGKERRSELRGALRLETYPWITLVHGLRQNPLSLGFIAGLTSADVIHCLCYSTLLTDLSVLFGRLSGKKVFITDVGGGGDVTLARVFDMTRLAHGLLLISQRAAREFPGHQHSRRAIYAGVDLERYRPGPEVRQRRVLYVGRLLPHKGINYLIEAVDRDIPLTIAGRPYHPRYHQLLQELAKGKDVTFHTDASDADVIRLYQTSAVSVLPTVHRTVYGDYLAVPDLLGFTLMEAMACATPVICTDAGSLNEVVTDGHDGFVVPQNDPEAIRARIVELLNQPEKGRQMGASARATIAQKFSWPGVVERCLRAYEGVAA